MRPVIALPPGLEELAQERTTFYRHDATDDFGAMIEPRMAQQVAHVPHRRQRRVPRALQQHAPDLRGLRVCGADPIVRVLVLLRLARDILPHPLLRWRLLAEEIEAAGVSPVADL